MFQEVDPVLGPEMRSTGEVLGLSTSYGEAFYKAQEAAQLKLPLEGTVLISVSDRDKPEVVEVAKEFAKAGFHIIASQNTCKLIREAGIPAEMVYKLTEGRPDMLDLITNGKIDLIVNTPVGQKRKMDDSYLRNDHHGGGNGNYQRYSFSEKAWQQRSAVFTKITWEH